MRNIPKELKFPLSGIGHDFNYRDATLPTEERTYATPVAKNVIGTCAFSGRLRGGSRPGLKAVNGVTTVNVGKWLWPNGEVIQWPDGANLTFNDFGDAADMPDGGRILFQHRTTAVYRDRLVKCEGSMWMASRTGDFSDFDFGADMDDQTKAVAGNIALAGRKGDAVTALVPVNDAFLFVATKRAIRMVQGEPTGVVREISDSVGIVSANAWCSDGVRIYFIGPNGLYGMIPGESPMLLSQKLPHEFKGIQSATLVYDPENKAIHIISSTYWYYDIDAKAFWPLAYNASLLPVSGGVAMVGGVNKVVFLCSNGGWYYWDDDTTKDGGTYNIESEIAIGPFRCGARDDIDGMLDNVTATLAKGSANVSMSVYSSNDAEGAVQKVNAVGVTVQTYTVSQGWNPVIRTRQRGSWAVIVLRATGKWAYESMLANIKTLGRVRP